MSFHRIGTMFLLLFFSLIVTNCAEEEALVLPTEEDPTSEDPNQVNTVLGNPDLVVEWTDLLLDLERYASGMRPNASARALAYIYLAAYETAVPQMEGYRSNDNRLRRFRIEDDQRDNPLSVELALNTAFAEVIDHFLLNLPSDQRDKISLFASEKLGELSAGLPAQEISNSEDWGRYVARQVISYSQTDEAAEEQILDPQPRSYEPPTGDGYWTYSADPERALFPYWEQVRTFVIAPEETTTVPPITYSSAPNSAYREQMEEVYAVNNQARVDDGEDLWIAEFWSDDVENLMFSPPARQVSIANQLIVQYDLNLTESLNLLLKVGFALNDAAVATWKYKYEHMVMRPNVFIHEFIDPDFQTNLFRLVFWPNPSFPGYPSGHSAFASAAGGIFRETFGNATNFTDRSHEGRTEFLGTPRTFTSFEQLAEENAFSRIPLGVHVRMDCTEGLRLGYEISDAINQLDLVQ
ncbi:MAG: vanadium-dependent haloperoxidase [Bacteroidota bacterium]